MMTGIQAEGSAPVVRAIQENLPEVIPEAHPETVATAIRIGAPVNAEKALPGHQGDRRDCDIRK